MSDKQCKEDFAQSKGYGSSDPPVTSSVMLTASEDSSALVPPEPTQIIPSQLRPSFDPVLGPNGAPERNAKGTSLRNQAADLSVNDKVNRATLTEGEAGKPQKCKYCWQRLSKLRKLEKRQSSSMPDSSRASLFNRTELPDKRDIGCQTSASLFDKAEMTQRELKSLAMILGFRDGKPLRTETFCKCVMHGKERDCQCGEEDKYFEWVWDAEHCGPATTLKERGRQVLFHQNYSCGTTAVRGQQAMDRDQYFWEIKMTTPVYGTDMMVGVGTSNVDLGKFHSTFCSMLGHDIESWGISYDGRVQHAGRKEEYCSRFGQGAIIGIHLDMWHGTIGFFKNRQFLGVAFRGLRGRTLYPMACSTAARSGMKVITSRSFPSSLQFLCCRRLRQFVPAHRSVLDLEMPPGLRQFLSNNMTWLLHVPYGGPPKPKPGFICHICMPLKNALEGCTDDEESSDEEDANHVQHVLDMGSSDEESDGEQIGSPYKGRQFFQTSSSLVPRDRSSEPPADGLPSTSSALPREGTTRATLHEIRRARVRALTLKGRARVSVRAGSLLEEGDNEYRLLGSGASRAISSLAGSSSVMDPDSDDAAEAPCKKARLDASAMKERQTKSRESRLESDSDEDSFLCKRACLCASASKKRQMKSRESETDSNSDDDAAPRKKVCLDISAKDEQQKRSNGHKDSTNDSNHSQSFNPAELEEEEEIKPLKKLGKRKSET